MFLRIWILRIVITSSICGQHIERSWGFEFFVLLLQLDTFFWLFWSSWGFEFFVLLLLIVLIKIVINRSWGFEFFVLLLLGWSNSSNPMVLEDLNSSYCYYTRTIKIIINIVLEDLNSSYCYYLDLDKIEYDEFLRIWILRIVITWWRIYLWWRKFLRIWILRIVIRLYKIFK